MTINDNENSVAKGILTPDGISPSRYYYRFVCTPRYQSVKNLSFLHLSLVIIMAEGPQYEHQYCIVKNAVNQPVLLRDSPAPSTFGLSFQGFGVTSACLGMFHQFNKHLCHFLESLWLIVLQLLHMQLCLVSVIKSIHDGQRLLRKWFNSSFELMRCVLP